MARRWRPLLVDASVLIDFAGTDPTVLTLVASHLAPVHVLRPVLAEVDQLDATGCDRLGLRIAEASLDQLLAAGARRGELSFEDRLCLIVARHEGWVCVTNDLALRKTCSNEGVSVLWGLELLLGLVEAGQLDSTDALSVATQIHLSNPRHITREILAEFQRRLLALRRT
jgi:predicted nucleic acid-binding protein